MVEKGQRAKTREEEKARRREGEEKRDVRVRWMRRGEVVCCRSGARVRGAKAFGNTSQHTRSFLTTAESIFEDLYVAKAYNTTQCGGGVFWGPITGTPGYKNAITNELFLALAGALYEATGKATYLDWAKRQWAWLSTSGMINSNGLFNDGLNVDKSNSSHCTNNQQTTWTCEFASRFI